MEGEMEIKANLSLSLVEVEAELGNMRIVRAVLLSTIKVQYLQNCKKHPKIFKKCDFYDFSFIGLFFLLSSKP